MLMDQAKDLFASLLCCVCACVCGRACTRHHIFIKTEEDNIHLDGFRE